jgi:hypothetical protein
MEIPSNDSGKTFIGLFSDARNSAEVGSASSYSVHPKIHLFLVYSVADGEPRLTSNTLYPGEVDNWRRVVTGDLRGPRQTLAT